MFNEFQGYPILSIILNNLQTIHVQYGEKSKLLVSVAELFISIYIVPKYES